VRVIREVVAGLKKRQRQRYEAHRLKNRTSVKVNKPGVFSVLDAAKEPSKEGGEIIVFKDRGSLKIDVAKSESKATTANDTLRVLNNLKAQGRLPLVAGTDNGSPFVAKAVIEFMEQNQVIHLKSLPSVPQHNGSAENAVGEVKSQIKHGATRDQACQTLNDHRMRESLNWQTATEYDQKNFEPCTKEKRAEFYHATKLAIKEAQLGIRTAYANVSSKNERRKAEREAIFQTMERFSLITRIRGHHHA
jgi:transposase InsO family protein